MAQNVTIQGASYTDVPSVTLPKTGGGTASFTDVTPTTAGASDVRDGTYFFNASGTLTLGTRIDQGVSVVTTQDANGGDIVTITATPVLPTQIGVIRGDAELVKTWTGEYTMSSKNITLPAYKADGSTTLIAKETIETYTSTDKNSYNYYVVARALTIPTYNTTTRAKGREEYIYQCGMFEWVYEPSGTIKSLDGLTSYSQYSQFQTAGVFTRNIYWSSGTAITPYTSASYGLAANLQSPAIGSNKNITIYTPTLTVRGHTTYFTQTFWEAVTDARIQYRFELWRTPKTSGAVNGWGHYSQVELMHDVIASASKNLR